MLSTHVPLGREVLARGIVFIDLAIAQVAALGVIAADIAGLPAQGWATQLAASGAALAGALFFAWTEKRLRQRQEAFIGSVFVLAACLALLVLHGQPHGAERLHDILEGQILWIDAAVLIPAAALYAVALALWFGIRARLGALGFYALFAVVVTVSVQIVGVYLVFASLIMPALAASRAEKRLQLVLAWLAGGVSYVVGLLMSFRFDLPAAPMIVCMLAVAGFAVWKLAPSARK
ncbi:MAG: metal ABC transporter permease [Gammaproteobacteria bacterium]|nr:metal ABC transporter permease [Gammaproteobacteria bacterium]